MTTTSPAGTPTSASSAPRFVGTIAACLVAIPILFVADSVLARIDRNESASHAASLYQEGRTFLVAGDARRATDRFAAAVAMERGNVDYELARDEAMHRDGRLADAELALEALLTRAQTDGAVNIAMAHVLEAEGHVADAKRYYHRAIYGRWRADSTRERLAARFELIDLLAREHATGELVAELLPLQETPPDSDALRRKVAHLFIVAGSPARGAAMFRAMLARDTRDVDAYRGMGDASLALGNLRTARADLLAARRLLPGDTSIVARLSIADTALALNPIDPSLSVAVRLERAKRVLELTIVDAARCGSSPPAIDSARQALATPPGPRAGDRIIEDLLSRATDLWKARLPACPPGQSIAERALGFVQARIAQ